MTQVVDYEVNVRSERGVRGFNNAESAADRYAKATQRATKQTGAAGASATQTASRMTRLSAATQRTGNRIATAGTKMRGLSLGLAGLGLAATLSANRYELEFSKITGLVGVAADEVAVMEANTLKLAGRTAQAPQELASAMFTIQSAGLRGARGTEALAEAAQLAAGGMGDARTIAQAMTSTLQAYASSNLTAAEGADFLAATARAGNFEASQLAGSLGKVLPIASNLGISLGDVGGSVALLTRSNGNAAQSITQVAAVMRVLLAPSSEARTILSDYGITMQDVKDKAAGPDGLVGALQLLKTAAGDDDETLARLLGSTEAVTAAFSILDSDAESLESTFGAVADSAGVAGEVFAAAAETDAFKFDQALTDMKVSAIELGDVLAPIVAGGMEKVSSAVEFASDAFGRMSPNVQSTVIGIGAIVAVAGPAALGIGKVVAAAGKLTPITAGLTAATLVAGFAVKNYLDEEQRAEQRVQILTDAMRDQGNETVLSVDRFSELTKKLDEFASAETRAASGAKDLSNVDVAALFDTFGDDGANAIRTLNDLGLTFQDVADAAQFGTDVFDDVSFHNITQGAKDLEENLEGATGATLTFGQKMLDGLEAQEINGHQLNALAGIIDKVADSYDEANESVEESARLDIEKAVAAEQLTQADVDGALAIAEKAGATHLYAEATKTLNPIIEASIAQEEKQAEELANVAANAVALTGVYDGLRTSTDDTADATDALASEQDALADSITPVQAAVMGLSTELQVQYDALLLNSEQGRIYRDVLAGLTGAQQTLDGAVLTTSRAMDRLAETKAPKVIDESNTETLEYLSTVRDAAGAVRDQALAMAENGATVEEITAFQEKYTKSISDTATEAGIGDQAVKDLIETYLTVPDEIITEIAVDTEIAQEDLNVFLDQGPNIIVAEAALDKVNAERELDALTADRVVNVTVNVEEVPTPSTTPDQINSGISQNIRADLGFSSQPGIGVPDVRRLGELGTNAPRSSTVINNTSRSRGSSSINVHEGAVQVSISGGDTGTITMDDVRRETRSALHDLTRKLATNHG